MVWKFDDKGEETLWIDVLADTDWAGDATTRRSTSGGMIAVGDVAIKHWSRTQKGRSLSSTEAEYYAVVSGSAEGLAVQAMAHELGWTLKVRVWTDSSGAKSAVSKRGLGKMRHIELKYLWIQEAVQRKRVYMRKIWGKINPADHFTKAQSKKEYEELLRQNGGEFRLENET